MPDSNNSTRDIAVEAKSLVNQHMEDCSKFRERLEITFSEVRSDLKSLNNRMMIIIGGLIVGGKILDYATNLFHK